MKFTEILNVRIRTKEKTNERLFIKQTFVALAPFLLTIGTGNTFGYTAILLPQLQTITPSHASWLASIAVLTMAFGCITSSLLLNNFGRKTTHILTCPLTILGWYLISREDFLVGRALTGFSCGVLTTASSLYIAETSSPEYRGLLLASLSFAVSLGLLLVHVLGTFLTWGFTAWLCCALPVVSLVLLMISPESPTYLAGKNQVDKAKVAWEWCRGTSEVSISELEILLSRPKVTSDKTSCFRREFLKPLGILVVFITANQWTGVNAISFYTVAIIKQTTSNGVQPHMAMLIVDTIRLIVSIGACLLLQNFGRRPLAIISGIGTFASLFLLSVYTLTTQSNPYIPLTFLITYICFVSIGFIPLPWVMLGEVFPVSTRNIGSGICSALAFLAFFAVIKTGPGMLEVLGVEGTFGVYGGVALVGTVFVAVFLPETKGRPLHEIEEEFARKKSKVAALEEQ